MSLSISQLASQLLESYQESYEGFGSNQNQSHSGKSGVNSQTEGKSRTVLFPSKMAIKKICESLLELLFPRFYGDSFIPSYQWEVVTKARLSVLEKGIQLEVYKNLTITPDFVSEETALKKATDITSKLLKKLPSIRKIIYTDIVAAYEGDPAAYSIDEIVASYPFIIAVSIQRFAHLLYLEDIKVISRMMTEWAHSITGIDIHPGATIGTHFFIDHGTGVVIGETCVIGNHVKLYHGVTLGARSFQKDDQGKIAKSGKRHPNVEDYVTIYPNSTVLGGDTTIGSHSTIGGNVFLLNSVPKNSLVYYEETQLKIISKQRAKQAAQANTASSKNVEKNSTSDLVNPSTDLLNAKTDLLNAKTDLLNAKTDLLNAKTDLLKTNYIPMFEI